MRNELWIVLRNEKMPESFEWLVLRAGIIVDTEIKNILADPSAYIDSKKFFSWERFFTDLLVRKTKDTYLTYTKRSLNHVYLQDTIKRKIIDSMFPLSF